MLASRPAPGRVTLAVREGLPLRSDRRLPYRTPSVRLACALARVDLAVRPAHLQAARRRVDMQSAGVACAPGGLNPVSNITAAICCGVPCSRPSGPSTGGAPAMPSRARRKPRVRSGLPRAPWPSAFRRGRLRILLLAQRDRRCGSTPVRVAGCPVRPAMPGVRLAWRPKPRFRSRAAGRREIAEAFLPGRCEKTARHLRRKGVVAMAFPGACAGRMAGIAPASPLGWARADGEGTSRARGWCGSTCRPVRAGA